MCLTYTFHTRRRNKHRNKNRKGNYVLAAFTTIESHEAHNRNNGEYTAQQQKMTK
jgi:hypothetical protein